MAKKFYRLLDRINNDIYSNKAIGLESDNVFEGVTEEPLEAIDSINEEVETQLDEDDGLFKEEEVEEDPSYTSTKDEWEAVSEDQDEVDRKNPEDCINLMEIVSCFTNTYRKNFVSMEVEKLVERTGDFKKHPMYTEIESVFESLTGMFNGTKCEAYEHLSEVRDLLHQERKMYTICGDEKAPFIYEGIQLAYVQQLHLMYLATPYTLKLKTQFEEAIMTMGFDKDINFFDKILKDVIDAIPALGSKIKYRESEKSEITGKDETIANTPYANSDIISEGHDTIVSDFEYAVESIQNLIEIKANKALLEYNVLIRDMALVTTYLIDFNPLENWPIIRESVQELITEEDTAKIEQLLVSTCSTLDSVLVRMVKAYKTIIKASSEN
ncbi:MAG: hypothetical protein ACRCX8_14185 [Sarcina sp.]